jgi:hypothetical protein
MLGDIVEKFEMMDIQHKDDLLVSMLHAQFHAMIETLRELPPPVFHTSSPHFPRLPPSRPHGAVDRLST